MAAPDVHWLTSNAVADRPAETAAGTYSCLHVRRCYARGVERRPPPGPDGSASRSEASGGVARGFLGPGRPPALDILLHCPDYLVRQPGTAGLDPARIVDAGRRGELVAIVRALAGGDDDAVDDGRLQALHRFFAELLELVPDVQALAGRAEALTTRLSGGLAEWARRITMVPLVSATSEVRVGTV